jgi:hypothetical protein
VWVLLAASCWSALGSVVGFALGCTGSRLPRRFGRPIAAVLRGLGLHRLAALVALP